jgi:hypothetical protein
MKFKELYAACTYGPQAVHVAGDRLTVDEAFKFIREVLFSGRPPDESFYSTTELSSRLIR